MHHAQQPAGSGGHFLSLQMRRHLQFIFELVLVVVLGAGVWYAFFVKVVNGPAEFQREIYVESWTRFFTLAGVSSLFLVVVYYATSFEITPLSIIRRFASHYIELSPRASDTSVLERAVRRRVEAEDILEQDVDRQVLPATAAEADTVGLVLESAARSAAKLAFKMERRINTHLILGVLVGFVGLGVWYYSFFAPSVKLSKDNLLAEVLPRVTILFFIELLAGFFLRQYRIGVEDLKYFLELQRRADYRRVAHAIYDRLGDDNKKVEFANTLLQEPSDTRLKSGETTTSIAALEKEQNEVLKAFIAAGDKFAEATRLLKSSASKSET